MGVECIELSPKAKIKKGDICSWYSPTGIDVGMQADRHYYIAGEDLVGCVAYYDPWTAYPKLYNSPEGVRV